GEASVAAVGDEYGNADEQRAFVGVEPFVDLFRRAARIKPGSHAQPLVAVGTRHGADFHRASSRCEQRSPLRSSIRPNRGARRKAFRVADDEVDDGSRHRAHDSVLVVAIGSTLAAYTRSGRVSTAEEEGNST